MFYLFRREITKNIAIYQTIAELFYFVNKTFLFFLSQNFFFPLRKIYV